MNLSDFRVLTFDCYGTLIDWESGILAQLRPWAQRSGISADDAALLTAFSVAESDAQTERPGALYPEILRDAHARIAAHFGAKPDPGAAAAFGDSVGDWPAFLDSPGALKQLQEWHKLVIVSNVNRASFEKSQKKLGVEFDAIVTAEEVGAYKPDPRMFRRALEVAAGLGAAPQQVLHVAQSLFHDHVPAKKLGLASVWIRRPSPRGAFGAARDPGEPVTPDWTVSSLAELVKLEAEERSAAAS
jgi:2-haloacid dehalogenase